MRVRAIGRAGEHACVRAARMRESRPTDLRLEVHQLECDVERLGPRSAPPLLRALRLPAGRVLTAARQSPSTTTQCARTVLALAR